MPVKLGLNDAIPREQKVLTWLASKGYVGCLKLGALLNGHAQHAGLHASALRTAMGAASGAAPEALVPCSLSLNGVQDAIEDLGHTVMPLALLLSLLGSPVLMLSSGHAVHLAKRGLLPPAMPFAPSTLLLAVLAVGWRRVILDLTSNRVT